MSHKEKQLRPFFISPSLLFSAACRGVRAALSDAVTQQGWNSLSAISLMLGDPGGWQVLCNYQTFLVSSPLVGILSANRRM